MLYRLFTGRLLDVEWHLRRGLSERLDLLERIFGVQREVARGIDDVADDAFSVDHVGRAGGDPTLFVEDAPDLSGAREGEVAEQREAEAELACVGSGGER